MVTDSEPPTWALDGFTHKGTPWAVPWALGTDGSAVAYVWARQLVAGTSPRADGSNNKILWLVKDKPSTSLIEGRPLGLSKPVVSVPGGPSIVDVPTAACWTFRVLWGAHNQNASTINLQVLAAGTLPSK